MGTNFYYKIPIVKRKQEELKELITESPNFSELKDAIYELEQSNSIHLGKRSYGWQFLWDFHKGKFYASNLESIKYFLETGGGYIEDEYGERFTTEQFFEDEIKDCLYKDDKHLDALDYWLKYPNERCGSTPTENEFIIDELRFSRHEDFS